MARVRRTKSGTVLTPEVEQELANEAEAGYDLEVATPRKVGRPSLGRGVSPRLDLRIETDLAEALHERAEEEHRSISAVAREALRRYLAS
ncbi:MAG: ribbon-helix-helix protein, CopG family [Acidimicrobiales bacterium]